MGTYPELVPATHPIGVITRGTTNPNRLRRVDRWLIGTHADLIRQVSGQPIVVDLGYGAHPRTTIELADRLAAVRQDVRVVGLEIDPARVRDAERFERPERLSLRFALGGFEVPLDPPGRPHVIRAFNVLRQYPQTDVEQVWQRLQGRLAPGGLLIEGTCDEIGRRAAWVALDPTGPVSLTLSMRLHGVERPSVIAERLPKVLIHRNVPGERIYALLSDLDDCWNRAAGQTTFGERQRFVDSVRALKTRGWRVLGSARRWRLGEVSVDWRDVAE